MGLSWFECLLYGLISGFCELLPVSALAHQTLFFKFTGGTDCSYLRVAAQLGAVLALIMVFVPRISKYRREQKIYRQPKKRRRRQPDFPSLMEFRFVRNAALWSLVAFLGYRYVYNLNERLWILSLFLIVNGIALYLPQYLPGATKQGVNMSALDGVVIGLCGGFGVIPGVSRFAAANCVAQLRGTERRLAADAALMTAIPFLVVLMVMEVVLLPAVPAAAVSFGFVLSLITVAIASFAAAYGAIGIVRYLSVKIGYSGFAYYSWGLALFTLFIYLI